MTQKSKGSWYESPTLRFLSEIDCCCHCEPGPVGSVVRVLDPWPGGCEFDPRLRRTFFPAYFQSLTSEEACEKSSRWLWQDNLCWYWCEKARKRMCVIDRHDIALSVKVALYPNTTTMSLCQDSFLSVTAGNTYNDGSVEQQQATWEPFSAKQM